MTANLFKVMKKIYEHPLFKYAASMALLLSVPQLAVGAFVEATRQPAVRQMVWWGSTAAIIAIFLIFLFVDLNERSGVARHEQFKKVVRDVINDPDGVLCRLKDNVNDLESQIKETRAENKKNEDSWRESLRDTMNDPRGVPHQTLGALKGLETKLDLLERRLANVESDRVYYLLGQRYGLSYEKLDVDAIIGVEGDVTIRRTITARTYGDVQPFIAQWLNLHDAEGPNLEELRKGRISVAALSPDFHADLIAVDAVGQGWVAKIGFKPVIPANTTIQFTMVENLKAGTLPLFLAKEEYQKRDAEYLYFAWRIDSPTFTYSMKMYFPAGYTPLQIEPLVIYQPAPARLRQARKHERACSEVLVEPLTHNDAFTIVQYSVQLPVLGLMYLLRWRSFDASAGDTDSMG